MGRHPSWREFIVIPHNGYPTVFLLMQWCLRVMSAASLEEIRALCDWSRLRVDSVPPSTFHLQKGIPEGMRIGNYVLLNYFHIRLTVDEDAMHVMDVTDTGSTDRDAAAFTAVLHPHSCRHKIQDFLREFIGLAESSTDPVLRATVRLIRFSTWMSWRCDPCHQWIQFLHGMVRRLSEEDPYGMEGCHLTIRDWLRLSMASTVRAQRIPHPMHRLDQVREDLMEAATIFQQEFRKICRHTTLESVRQGCLAECARIIPCSPGCDGRSNEDTVRGMAAQLRQWLIDHMKFIPFTQIRFDRMCQALLVFRYGRTTIGEDILIPSSSPDWSFLRTDPLMDPRFLFDMLCVYLEPYDRKAVYLEALRRCASDTESHDWSVLDAVTGLSEPLPSHYLDHLSEFHPMYRTVENLAATA